MNHLESTFTGKNSLWRYLVMIIAVFLVSNTIGALPLLAGLFIKSLSNPNLFTLFSANPNDYSITGFSLNILLVFMLFPFIAGLAAIMFLIKPLHSRTIKSVINGTSGIRWNRFFISFLIWLGLSAMYLIFYLKISPQNFSINNKSFSIIVLAIISLTLIPFQAGFEEVLFRGYLMQGFSAIVRYRWFPLIMTSVLFGLMHALNPEVKEYGFLTMMPQYILFGLIFGVITILDDGIEASAGAHAANNIFLCIMVTNKSSALQTAAFYEQQNIYPWIELISLLITGIVFILILKLIFGWKDFSVISGIIEKPLKSDPVN
jgi:membrane protease YdiL (CAAX protease family)